MQIKKIRIYIVLKQYFDSSDVAQLGSSGLVTSCSIRTLESNDDTEA